MKSQIKDNKELFKEQEFALGIDSHKRNFKITIRNNSRVIKKFSMNPEPEQLYNYLVENYPGGIYKSVYEAGFGGFWLHRALTKLGINNIVVNPADVPTTQKEKSNKTDKIDSGKLARELENNSLTAIYIPTDEQEALRNISRLRTQIVKESTRTKNRIKSFLNLYGIKLPENSEEKHWSRAFINRIKSIEFQQENNTTYRDNLITELEHQRKRKIEILKLIRNISSNNEIIKYLMSVPGIGTTVAFTLYAELYDIKRFSTVDQLCSIIGLVPSVSESDQTKKNFGLTQRANNILRSQLIEAAWLAIRRDPALTYAFNQYCKRMTKNKAIIRITRKLVSRIRYVWFNHKNYVFGVIQ